MKSLKESKILDFIKMLMASFLEAISKPEIQDRLIKILRTKFVENLIVNTLKLSGIRAWLLGLLADRVIEIGDEKLIEPFFSEIGYTSDTLEGARIFKKVKNAQDADEWVDTVINDM